MLSIKIPIALTLVIFNAGFARAQDNDWLIIPGKRLGSITPYTSRGDLDQLFGEANVQDRPVDTGEGPEPGTVVLPTVPDATIAILWEQTQTDDRKHPGIIMICYKPLTSRCKWHTENGVSLGTTLEKLEILNGNAFEIQPWGFDGQGSISSWLGGKLATVFDDGGTSWYGARSGLKLRLYYLETPQEATQQRKLIGQIYRLKRIPRSSDPAMRQLHLKVKQMNLVFPLRGDTGRAK